MGGPTAVAPPSPSALRLHRRLRSDSARPLLRLPLSDRGSVKRLAIAETRASRADVAAALSKDGNGAQVRPLPRRRLPPSAVTYSASISTDLPLEESPWASFDEYLEDRPRVFRAMFPDKRRSQRLNDEEWRIRMLPVQFILISADPVIDMRLQCRSYPNGTPSSGVPLGVTRVLELQATRWELRGLDSVYVPPHFELDVRGVLYADRGRGRGRTRLKGDLQMSISLVIPAVLALLPDEVLRSVAETLLKRLVERMKQEVDVSLLADYRVFSKEMLKQQRQNAAARQITTVPSKGDQR